MVRLEIRVTLEAALPSFHQGTVRDTLQFRITRLLPFFIQQPRMHEESQNLKETLINGALGAS